MIRYIIDFDTVAEVKNLLLQLYPDDVRDIMDVLNQLTELKPDRRAEVLELAGRLAAALLSGPNCSPTKPLDAGRVVGTASDIINAVDEATGAKVSEAVNADGRDHEADFEAFWPTSHGDSTERRAARRAWFAARGVKL